MIFDVNAWLGEWPFRSLNNNTPEALIAHLDRSGIDRAAVGLLDGVLHRNPGPSNERLARLVEPHSGHLVPVGIVNPTYVRWEDDVAACHEKLGMKGIRLFPVYHNYTADGPEAKAVVQACADRGLPVQIPFRMEDPRQRHWMDPGRTVDLNAVANLLAAVPSATLIVTNARSGPGLALWQREDLRDKNWFVDLSCAEVHRNLGKLADEGGAGHILFGSHVPFSYTASALVKLATLPVDDETREMVAGGKAQELFG